MENKAIHLMTGTTGCLFFYLDEGKHLIMFNTPSGGSPFPLCTSWLPTIMTYVEKADQNDLVSRLSKETIQKIVAIAGRANGSVHGIQESIDAAEASDTPDEWKVGNDAYDPVKREKYRVIQRTMSERAWKIITDLIQQTLEENDDGKQTASTLEDTRKDMIPRLRETLGLLKAKAPEQYDKAMEELIQFVHDNNFDVKDK